MSTLGQRMGLVADRPSSKCIGPEGCVEAMTELQAENKRLARERDEAVELVVLAAGFMSTAPFPTYAKWSRTGDNGCADLLNAWQGSVNSWLDRAAPIVGEAT